ncbi:rab proteins geranylgeranyltransferase component A 2-like isoform X2 [Myxocyprinus asiaticus]|uniref:rab proteins geranylgeranyltransferase component A 2-like isoform X2 n=1 Tax=Myxocyprinus asiaticus TaxID=70543 RepID=UPI002222EB91|nr:rab proteins geranylgeranyltransferase component A 2-like isoform X2 [Myxocyprinus asiaticus]
MLSFSGQASPSLSLQLPAPESDRAFCIWTASSFYRRNYYAGNWASFTFNGLLSWIEEYKNQQEVLTTESEQVWRSLIDEGEDVVPLNSVDSSISNLEVFCYASEEEEKEEETKVSLPSSQPVNTQTTSEETNSDSTEGQETVTTDDPTEAVVKMQKEGDEIFEPTEEKAIPEISDSSQSQEEKEQQPISSPADPPVEKITYQKLLKEGRRFNIDLVSKLMYSRGALVDLLIKSNVSRYAEFKNISRILTCRNGKVEQVPCSRADVFASKQLTVVEKRMLMKYLTFCLDFEQHPEEYQDSSEKPFREFLKTKKLTENLQDFVLHSIAMVSQETPTEEGLKATQHFLRCLGRYGNTPFLFPLYGLGEIPQCFCRMCAVFGGIYCLRHSVQCLVVDKASNKVKAVIDTRSQRINCSHFVVEDSYIRDEQRQSTTYRQISRAVLITDRSVLPSESEQQISLVTVPSLDGSLVRMVELCSSSMTCMPGTYLVHLTCSSSGSAQEDLAPVISRLFYVPSSPGEEPEEGAEERSKPTVLWVMYFSMRDTSVLDSSSYSLPNNVHLCTGPDARLGSDYSIKLAESVFHHLLPDEEFCPPAPNPEDIIYDGDGSQAEGAGFDDTNNTEGDNSQAEEEGVAQEKSPSAESSEASENIDSTTQETPLETTAQTTLTD